MEDKEYLCPRVPEHTDIAWGNIPEIRLVNAVTGNKTAQETLLRICYDDEAIYARFNYKDSHVKAGMHGFNELIYQEDVVELFLDEDCDLLTYHELELNPNNAVLYYFILKNADGRTVPFARIENPIKTSFERDGDNMTGTLHIPFTEFHRAAKSGDKWRCNFYRIDRAENDENTEFQSWNVIGQANFHRSDRFGTMIFE